MALVVLGLIVATMNFFLSFIRPLCHLFLGGSKDDYRQASGAPLVGNVLVCLGLLAGFGAIVPTTIAGFATLIDTGGLPWFLAATWRSRDLWDDKR